MKQDSYIVDLTQTLWASEPVAIAHNNYVYVAVDASIITGAWDSNPNNASFQHQVSNNLSRWESMTGATNITAESTQQGTELSEGISYHRIQMTSPNGTTTTNVRARITLTYRTRPFA